MQASTPALRSADETPRWFDRIANGSSLLLLLALLAFARWDPAGFAFELRKDSFDGGGWFERLPAIVLIPGIVAGLFAFFRHRHRLPARVLGYWLLCWVIACVYFAGEEESWGQWYFQWQTPESFAAHNRQRETNLHNTSSWLNEKPRAMVELFIFVAGFLIPLLRALGLRRPIFRGVFLADWERWLYAPRACLVAGMLFTLVRIAKWLPQYFPENFGDSEFREFCIAWFLMWYLLSFYVRLARGGADRPGQRF